MKQIGEKFKIGCLTLRVEARHDCLGCHFNCDDDSDDGCNRETITGEDEDSDEYYCSGLERDDETSVIYVKCANFNYGK